MKEVVSRSRVDSASGDQRVALCELYEHALPEVYGYLLHRCGAAALAEDLASETFMAAVDAVKHDRVPQLNSATSTATNPARGPTMSDPLDRLRATDTEATAAVPRSAFARSLRRRMIEALDLRPSDLTIDLPERTPMTGTSTTSASTAPVRAESLVVYLTVHDGAAAIDFYSEAFGAVEEFRVVGPDGRLGHAELQIGKVHVMLSDEFPEMGVKSPLTLGGSGVGLSLHLDDCDAAFASAIAAGATELRPPADQDHGNRMAVVTDPFGHRWFLTQEIEEFDLDTYAERSAQDGEWEVTGGPAAGTPHDTGDVYTGGVWPTLMYEDAPAAIRFVRDVLGFTEQIVVTHETDPHVIVHSQLAWPEGGVVQIGTAEREGNMYSRQPTGTGSLYIVTSDPEAVLARCEAAGAEIADPMREVEYDVPGSRSFTARDSEGNLWCFGTYAGEG